MDQAQFTGIFDIYKNEEQLGKGKKSYAINLLFSHPDRTLIDKDVDKVIKKIVGRLQHELHAELR